MCAGAVDESPWYADGGPGTLGSQNSWDPRILGSQVQGAPPGPKPTTDETESGVRKSCCFKAPPALLRFFGGPTANLSRFPWSGASTLNLLRFPSLGWSCGYSLVFSGVLVVLRSISRVFLSPAGPAVNLSCFRGFLVILRPISRVIRCCPLVAGGPAVVQACASCVAAFVWWSYGNSLAFSVV